MDEKMFVWYLAGLFIAFVALLFIMYHYAKASAWKECQESYQKQQSQRRFINTQPVSNTPNLISPGESADLQSILAYLSARKTYKNKAPYNTDIMTALSQPYDWSINNEVDPPTAMYLGSTKSNYWLVWDKNLKTWDVTTLSPYLHPVT